MSYIMSNLNLIHWLHHYNPISRDYQSKRLIPPTKVIPLELFLGMVPSSSSILLACCVDVFLEDLFMCRFVSKWRETSNAVGMEMPSFKIRDAKVLP